MAGFETSTVSWSNHPEVSAIEGGEPVSLLRRIHDSDLKPRVPFHQACLYVGHRLFGMSMIVTVPESVARRLEAATAARGISVDEIATEVLAAHTPEPSHPMQVRRHLALTGTGASGHGLSHRIDEMLADGFGRD